MTFKLIMLWQKMSELTAPECAKNCRSPHSCCSPEYCDMATGFLSEANITVEPTGHPTLKYMGPSGCIVPPEYRPLCTLHTCAINSLGFKPGDPAWTTEYENLREQIDIALFEEKR